MNIHMFISIQITALRLAAKYVLPLLPLLLKVDILNLCFTLVISSFLLFLQQVDLHFMKKIPEGAEASNVLVGVLDFLERPIVAFVRLSPAVLLTGLTEVPIPTR